MGMHTVEYCPKCKKYLNKGATVCPTCGTAMYRIKPKRQKGMKMNWNGDGRKLCWLIANQFRKQKGSKYVEFMKMKHSEFEKMHSDWTKLRLYNSVNNVVGRLFLAHFYEVMRKIEGKPVSEPYVQKFMGHTNITKPFYWDESILKKD